MNTALIVIVSIGIGWGLNDLVRMVAAIYITRPRKDAE